jgi:hypothetical protein
MGVLTGHLVTFRHLWLTPLGVNSGRDGETSPRLWLRHFAVLDTHNTLTPIRQYRSSFRTEGMSGWHLFCELGRGRDEMRDEELSASCSAAPRVPIGAADADARGAEREPVADADRAG